MKSKLTFTPEVVTCCTVYNHCDDDYYYYFYFFIFLTVLVIYEHLNILAMFCYNLHPAQPEEDWPPLIDWFLSRFWHFLGVLPSHRASTPALLAVLGWVSVQHFVTSADVRRAL